MILDVDARVQLQIGGESPGGVVDLLVKLV